VAPVKLTHEIPFGITAIVGGTNVRFTLSVPHNTKPITESITWKDLRADLTPLLAKEGIEFEDAKDIVLAEIAKRFSEFVAKQFPEDGPPPPFHNICAFDLSVAGIVEGEGYNASVTTTNTGINLKGEALAIALLNAINGDLSSRNWSTIPHASTVVLNDATAGALGEYHGGDLQNVDNGLFVIIGTGVGSMALVKGRAFPKFSELGHSVIVSFENKKKKFTVVDGTQVQNLLDEHGNWKDLEHGHTYVENTLAGPWFAINFVRKLIPDHFAPVLKALAEKIKKQMPADYKGDLFKDLFDLGDKSVRSRQRWAIDSSSALIKAINSHILIPDLVEAFRAAPCTGKSDEWLTYAKPEQVLNYLAWVEHWKSYFKDVGEALGAVYKKMSRDEIAPERIVLGGGIAEACQQRLPDALKEIALELIHDHGHLPRGTVVFSSMSPEARESAVTLARVNKVYQHSLEYPEWQNCPLDA
jgi:hypothetical protein